MDIAAAEGSPDERQPPKSVRVLKNPRWTESQKREAAEASMSPSSCNCVSQVLQVFMDCPELYRGAVSWCPERHNWLQSTSIDNFRVPRLVFAV
jgi:hypothetical protein